MTEKLAKTESQINRKKFDFRQFSILPSIIVWHYFYHEYLSFNTEFRYKQVVLLQVLLYFNLLGKE